MTRSKVYYFGSRGPISYVGKGQTLFEEAKLDKCFKSGDRVTVKIHCGEWNKQLALGSRLIRILIDFISF